MSQARLALQFPDGHTIPLPRPSPVRIAAPFALGLALLLWILYTFAEKVPLAWPKDFILFLEVYAALALISLLALIPIAALAQRRHHG